MQLSLIHILAAIMTPMASAASVSATKKGAALQFHQDGKFKIMMILSLIHI